MAKITGETMKYAILIKKSLTLRKFATKSEFINAIADQRDKMDIMAFKFHENAETWVETEIVL